MDMKESRVPTVSELDKWIHDVLAGKISTEHDDDDYRSFLELWCLDRGKNCFCLFLRNFLC